MDTATSPLQDIHEMACGNCGATLTYAPGTRNLTCHYCGSANEIASTGETVIVENDYHAFLASVSDRAVDREHLYTVRCASCGAATTLTPNVTSDKCPFCDTPLVIKEAKTLAQIKPRYLLPFGIDRQRAHQLFTVWIAKRWFAPNDLKRSAANPDKIKGLYIPYWTYDAQTSSNYSGERGTNHTEHYTTVVNGKRVTQTRTVIHWHRVNGHVTNSFDDVLVVASTSLPEKYANRLEPWDLRKLVPFNESFLAGFRTETYRVGLEAGFDKAKVIMDKVIRELIRRDIGGDHQRILSVNTVWNGITFKHILLPIWISAYRHRGNVFRFMINGRTGEVQGERPWSVVKIVVAAAAGLAVLGGVWYFLQPYVR